MNTGEVISAYKDYLKNSVDIKDNSKKTRFRVSTAFINGIEKKNIEDISITDIECYLNNKSNSLTAVSKRFLDLKLFFDFLNAFNFNKLNLREYSINDFKLNIIPHISKEDLMREIQENNSKISIANKYGVSETEVKYIKQFYGIDTGRLLKEDKDKLVKGLFLKKGMEIEVVENAICRYRYREIRISASFSTSYTEKSSRKKIFQFNLKRYADHFREVNEEKFRNIRNNILVPKFEDICDVIIFIGINANGHYIWIMKSDETFFKKGHVALNIVEESIHQQWRENWNVFEQIKN